MEIIPHPAWTLCKCGFGVATVPFLGSFICNECAEALRTERALASTASVMLKESEPQSLDSLLEKLVKP